jgi:hypothetical protein
VRRFLGSFMYLWRRGPFRSQAPGDVQPACSPSSPLRLSLASSRGDSNTIDRQRLLSLSCEPKVDVEVTRNPPCEAEGREDFHRTAFTKVILDSARCRRLYTGGNRSLSQRRGGPRTIEPGGFTLGHTVRPYSTMRSSYVHVQAHVAFTIWFTPSTESDTVLAR